MNAFEIIMGVLFLLASIGAMVCVASQDHEQKRGGISNQTLISNEMEIGKKRVVTEKMILNRITIGCGIFMVVALIVYYAIQ